MSDLPFGASDDIFGHAIDCSSNAGDTLVIGDLESLTAGSAFVYRWNATTTQQYAPMQTLQDDVQPRNSTFDFGEALSISAYGSMIVVGSSVRTVNTGCTTSGGTSYAWVLCHPPAITTQRA